MCSSKKLSQSDLMKVAIEEHLKSCEYPRVGCVIARDGEIISTGYRGELKGIHAERVAIKKVVQGQLVGTELYTTLEPCIELHDSAQVESCADLIISSGISSVIIGVLDPNGTIYSKGFRRLLENDISVSFFTRKLREAVEENTFEYSDFHTVVGNGKRRFPVIGSEVKLNFQFSENDKRMVSVRWSSIQYSHKCVDLIAGNGEIIEGAGARNFGDITDISVFRHPSHFLRMRKDTIAIVNPPNASFSVLIQMIEIFENDIFFKWEVRNKK